MPEELLAKIEGPRRDDIVRLDQLIRKLAPELKPIVQSGMLAYGPTHLKYASGREVDWFMIGLANQKNYISLYACAADARGYVAERYRDALPKADIGKTCVRFKRLSDLDEKALSDLIRETAKTGFQL